MALAAIPAGVQRGRRFERRRSETLLARGHLIWPERVVRIQTGRDDSRKFFRQGKLQRHDCRNGTTQGRAVTVRDPAGLGWVE